MSEQKVKEVIDEVTAIEGGETANGKKFIKILTPEDIFFVWNVAAFNEKEIHEGDKVKIRYRDGDFKRVIAIDKVGEQEQRTIKDYKKQGRKDELSRRDIAITRMSVLQSLARLLQNENKLSFDEKLDEIKAVAPMFERWILTGEGLNDARGISEKAKG